MTVMPRDWRVLPMEIAEATLNHCPWTLQWRVPTVVSTPRSPYLGRKARGRRALPLFVAATAVAAGLPLYTRNPEDFAALTDILEVVGV